MTEFVGLLVLVLVGIFGALGHSFGQDAGKSNLCHEQFQGEMREGKCVRVTTEVVTIEPKK